MKPISRHSGNRPRKGRPQAKTTQQVSISLTNEVIERLAELPQLTSGEWKKSYLVDQALRVILRLPSDYELHDFEIIAANHIVE